MRVACLLVPDLPLVAALRAEPHLAPRPRAIVQAGSDLGGRALVVAATPAASCVAAGMTLAEARSLCPGPLAGARPARAAPRRRPGRRRGRLRRLSPRRGGGSRPRLPRRRRALFAL